jgi:hypothetical protein
MNKVIEARTKRKKIVEKKGANGKKNGAKLQTSSKLQAEDDWDDDPFFSPVISSVKVKMKLHIGGKVEQPPIDEDDLIYWDE